MELSVISGVEKIFLDNRRIVSGQQFTIAEPNQKQSAFLSCLNAIVLRHFDPKSAEKEIISVFNLQLAEGKIIQESNLTVPPLIAYSALEVFRISKNQNFLEKIYLRLDKYYKWLSTIRDPYSQNILSIIHPKESFLFESENDKEILEAYKNTDYNDSLFLQRGYFNSKDLFFNCIYLESLRSMTEISKIVGQQQSFYKRKYEYSKEAIKNNLYDQTRNLFFSNTEEKLTPLVFLPLFANLLTSSQASDLVNKHLLNEQEFWTEYPVPTLSFSEKDFDSTTWRKGASSILVNWFIFRGLLNYNLTEAAELLYEKTLDLTKNGFFEFYNSTTGEAFGEEYTLSCLVLDMENEIRKVL